MFETLKQVMKETFHQESNREYTDTGKRVYWKSMANEVVFWGITKEEADQLCAIRVLEVDGKWYEFKIECGRDFPQYVDFATAFASVKDFFVK